MFAKQILGEESDLAVELDVLAEGKILVSALIVIFNGEKKLLRNSPHGSRPKEKSFPCPHYGLPIHCLREHLFYGMGKALPPSQWSKKSQGLFYTMYMDIFLSVGSGRAAAALKKSLIDIGRLDLVFLGQDRWPAYDSSYCYDSLVYGTLNGLLKTMLTYGEHLLEVIREKFQKRASHLHEYLVLTAFVEHRVRIVPTWYMRWSPRRMIGTFLWMRSLSWSAWNMCTIVMWTSTGRVLLMDRLTSSFSEFWPPSFT